MVMVGSHFWRGLNGLKKCSERTRASCTDHADCCAVTACTYCLELEVYSEDIQYGVADQSDSHWTGTVGGHTFDAYWDRDYLTDECLFTVEFDGDVVYQKSCYDGQSCRDSSDETGVTVDYEDAVLRWIKNEPLPLPHINDPDTGCKTWFCGECECSCECLCVTIRNGYGFLTDEGEICNVAYECEGPVWSGSVGDYELSLALERDEYGNCVIAATVDGTFEGIFEVSGCKDLSATIELDDGTTISVSCKICSCEMQATPCEEGCCVPWHVEPAYPNGVLDNIPFCLTSSCLSLDGECGIFAPLDPTSPTRGSCGFCATYIGAWVGAVPGEFPTFLEDPAHPGQCKMSPCSVTVCLVLECNSQEDAVVGQNACSSKMRLWVGTSVLQEGDVGDRPGYEVAGCTSWKKIPPTMSECAEEGAGFIAEFGASISIVCTKVVGGICDGKDNCCQVACSFAVVI